jgi:energy-coupling factor transporter ATP-binding protein EcfA2
MAWRQYYDVDLTFHSRLTVLTGANGAGKTTILNLLGRFYGWNTPLVSTPRGSRTTGAIEYFAGILDKVRSLFAARESAALPRHGVGTLSFSDGTTAQLSVPESVEPTFQLNISPLVPLAGLNIPSHRPVYNYSSVASIPTGALGRRQLFDAYHTSVRTKYYNQWNQETPGKTLKQDLIALAMFGYGNEAVQGNSEAVDIYQGFEKLLRLVLPPELGFEKLSIRNPEVVLVTRGGDFSLDAISGGIASIIDITWQIYTYAPASEEFVVTFDEPENHLHPKLQVRLLPTLVEAFPKAQFIIATHNPLIIGSYPEASVYALRYNEEGLVESVLLDLKEKAGTANDILRDVLGLAYTMPIWAAQRLETVLAEFRHRPITKESLRDLRSQLTEIGMSEVVPEAISSVLDGRPDLS